MKIQTDRLVVRRPHQDDLEDYLAYRNHRHNLEMQPTEPTSSDSALKYLSHQSEMKVGSENTWVMLAVESKDHGKVIGEVGVFLNDRTHSVGNIGWIIHPDFQRMSYATEAAHALLIYVFEHEELRRVTANCLSENIPSFRLMERLGMRREGHLQKSRERRGLWLDEFAYALLREEWSASKGSQEPSH